MTELGVVSIISASIIIPIIVVFKILYGLIEEEVGLHRWVFGWMKWKHFVTLIKFMKSYKKMDDIALSNIKWGSSDITWFTVIALKLTKNNTRIIIKTKNLEINNQEIRMCLFQYLVFKHYVHKIRRYVKNQKKLKKIENAMENINQVMNTIEKASKEVNDEKKGALSIL